MGRQQVISSLKAQLDAMELRPASPREQGAVRDEPCSEADAAFKKIIDLVNASDKSERTIRERLKQKGYGEAAIDDAVSRALDYGFIDDKRYAEILARSRMAQGRGRAGIERELRSHGIDPDLVGALDDEGLRVSDDELDRALRLLEAKPPRSKNLREGAYRKLMQKGYSSSVASSASRIWAERCEGFR